MSAPSSTPASGARGTSVVTLTRIPSTSPINAPTPRKNHAPLPAPTTDPSSPSQELAVKGRTKAHDCGLGSRDARGCQLREDVDDHQDGSLSASRFRSTKWDRQARDDGKACAVPISHQAGREKDAWERSRLHLPPCPANNASLKAGALRRSSSPHRVGVWPAARAKRRPRL